MIDLTDYIDAGELTKTHGVRGQVVLQLDNLSFENILKMESVIINMDGLPVPFFLESFSQRNNNSIVLTIEDIDTELKAEELIGKRVFVKSNNIRLSKLINDQSNDFKGFTVTDKNKGELGILEEILDSQYNPLLRIIREKKEILIPFQEEFILKIDKKAKKIFVNTPEGLTELFD
jgi:16S rRNA processing protein RimM